jgi:hypothetical protein
VSEAIIRKLREVRSTNGKNDWIREIGPRTEDWKVSCHVSGVIVSIGPVG